MSCFRVEARSRLVEHENPRVVDHGLTDCDSLAQTPRQLPDPLVQTIRQAQPRGGLGDRIRQIARHAVGFRRVTQTLLNVQVVVKPEKIGQVTDPLVAPAWLFYDVDTVDDDCAG